MKKIIVSLAALSMAALAATEALAQGATVDPNGVRGPSSFWSWVMSFLVDYGDTGTRIDNNG